MILKSIILDNIRSYTYQEVRFPKGAVLLSGDIGAGKSTILHAIEFALFGVQRGDLSGSSLLRHGKNEGFVQLTFELGGKEVIIRRTLKRSKQGIQQDAGHLVIDGSMVEATPIELKTHILSMLGYPKDILKAKSFIYRYTVYTPQEQMKQILFDDREARLDTLRKVFGIDRYKRMSENAAMMARGVRERMRLLEGQLSGMEEKRKLLERHLQEQGRLSDETRQLEARLAEARGVRERLRLEVHHCEEDMKALNELRQQLRVAETALRERGQLKERYQRDLATLTPQLAELRQRLDAIQAGYASKEQLETTVQEREKGITVVLQREAELKEKLSSLDAQLSSLEKEMQAKRQPLAQHGMKRDELGKRMAFRKDREVLRLELQQHDDALRQLLLRIQEHDVHVKHASGTIEKVSRLDRCPLCLQSVSPDHKYEITAEENRRIEEHGAMLRDLHREKGDLEGRRREMQKRLDEAQENETRLATLEAELASLSRLEAEVEEKRLLLQRLLTLRQEALQQRETYAAFDVMTQQATLERERLLLKRLVERQHLQQLLQEREAAQRHLAAALEEAERTMAHLEEERRALEAQLGAKAHLEERHARLRKEADLAMEEERRVEVRHAAMAKELDGVGRFVASLSEELRQKEEARREAARLSQLERWLGERLINLLSVMERQVMLRVYQEFNELFQKWFGMLMEDEAMLVRLDAEFTPLVEQNGYETDLDALSGGEKTAVALAYRLALNRVINDVISSIQTKDLIILDEPTDGFSQQQLDRLKDILDQLGIPQVLVVSHESKVEGFVDHVLRVEKAHHISRVMG